MMDSNEKSFGIVFFQRLRKIEDDFQLFPVRKDASLNGLYSAFALLLIFVTFQEVLLLHQRAIH